MKKRCFFFIPYIFVILFLTGCGPSNESIQKTNEMIIEKTVEKIPAYTPYPIATIRPTFTKYPTHTANPTHTAFPTHTVLPTYTKIATGTFQFTFTPQPTDTTYPTSIPLLTYTKLPTNTAQPANTSFPTHTAMPTYTKIPTGTDQFTSTPLTVFTVYPTNTPYAVFTKLPTSTPRATYTFLPTYTPFPTFTEIPTTTSTPSKTPQPTLTPTLTHTATNTATSTSTNTLTPVPPTSTATATPEASNTPTLGIGSTRIRKEDGMTMVYVPAGEFEMGSDKDWWSDEQPAHRVYLDEYWIDRTEVTNEQYESCVAAGSCTEPMRLDSYSRRDSYYGNRLYADYPVIYVDWNQAAAYCVWAGGRLPTEAEWEKAARGTDGRIYPWGDTIDKTRANYNGNVGDTTSVGSYPAGASPYGALDMAGNVFEWVSDWYVEDYYDISPEQNPSGPEMGESRMPRGGSWYSEDYESWSTYRGRYYKPYRFLNVGIRCAFSSSMTSESEKSKTLSKTPQPTKTPTMRVIPAPTIVYGIVYVPNDVGLLIRQKPGNDGTVMQSQKNGSRLEIIGENTETIDGITWINVRTNNGVEGWVTQSTIRILSSRIREIDGMTMVYVPAGEFEMGSYFFGYSDEQPVHSVNLDAYWIDQTEVTNGQYERCVAAGICSAPEYSGSNTRDSYYDNSTYADYPVIHMNWDQAAAYCAWAGGRLPTEAEWEKAARGTDGGTFRYYPWGDEFDGTKLNYCDKNCSKDWKDEKYDDGYVDTAPIGSYPAGASPYGALDMVGNVWEWASDWYAEDYYKNSPDRNPIGPQSGEYRVLRGGSWASRDDLTRSACRGGELPSNLLTDAGFRCAFAVDPISSSPITVTESPDVTLLADDDEADWTDQNILKSDKPDGFYLVGTEIEPGVWKTEDGKSKCYWKITDIKGNIISNYLGAGGGTIFIDENAYQIETINCGTIIYLGDPSKIIPDESIRKSDKPDGFYLVDTEIEPGVWKTEEGKSKCYWKITDNKGNIISNYLGAGGGTIFIDENAYQIEILNCGITTYIETYQTDPTTPADDKTHDTRGINR